MHGSRNEPLTCKYEGSYAALWPRTWTLGGPPTKSLYRYGAIVQHKIRNRSKKAYLVWQADPQTKLNGEKKRLLAWIPRWFSPFSQLALPASSLGLPTLQFVCTHEWERAIKRPSYPQGIPHMLSSDCLHNPFISCFNYSTTQLGDSVTASDYKVYITACTLTTTTWCTQWSECRGLGTDLRKKIITIQQ